MPICTSNHLPSHGRRDVVTQRCPRLLERGDALTSQLADDLDNVNTHCGEVLEHLPNVVVMCLVDVPPVLLGAYLYQDCNILPGQSGPAALSGVPMLELPVVRQVRNARMSEKGLRCHTPGTLSAG